MLRRTHRLIGRDSVVSLQDYVCLNPRISRAFVAIALFATLMLVMSCVSLSPVDPDSSITAQQAVTSQAPLPQAAVSSATPVIVEVPATMPTFQQSTEDAGTPSPAEPALPEPVPQVPVSSAIITYTVKPGDTLLGLALDFGVPMAAIQLSNNLGEETAVWVDQVLRVPQEAMWAEASPFWIVHLVAGGETLSELAAQFGLGLGVLLEANGLSDADFLSIGQSLILPLDGPVESVVAAPVLAVVPEPEVASTPIPDTLVAVPDAGDQEVDVAVSVSPTAVPIPIPTVAASADVSADTSALAGEIFRLINEQRVAYSLPPLAWNGTLAYAAQSHADDCYTRGWCSHTGSDGSTYKERIIRAGYEPVRWSECWAWYSTPEMAVAMWMDEVPPNDPHRRTLLSDYLTEVGVGVVPGNGHGYYFIADFGAP